MTGAEWLAQEREVAGREDGYSLACRMVDAEFASNEFGFAGGSDCCCPTRQVLWPMLGGSCLNEGTFISLTRSFGADRRMARWREDRDRPRPGWLRG